ncbi:transmembrane protein 273 [Pteronotus mesoamericanus]|uniref:transmembrane protein 273 n=1 Tax=Pteronotus mesoamericanus TaxID=1884717 RepID=UPI0023EA9B36|nr:transmembrane protein 273 [Pteronotus parnellii mesoamericanus]
MSPPDNSDWAVFVDQGGELSDPASCCGTTEGAGDPDKQCYPIPSELTGLGLQEPWVTQLASACSVKSQEQRDSMGSATSMLRALFFLLDSGFSFLADVGGARVLATGKSAGVEADIKYAIIGMALGVAILAGFLALKICMIKKHLFDIDSSDLRFNAGAANSIALKRTSPRLIPNLSERDAQVIEL